MAEVAVKQAWHTYSFDEMATMVSDRVDNPEDAGVDRYVGLEHLEPESLKVRRWGSPSDVTATKLRFRKGDIIFGRRRVYQRKLAVADFDGICSAHAMVLRARPEVVVPEFLPFFMQSDSFMELAKEISVGSLSPTINWKTLAKQEFALPPLAEQRRIVELLRQSDETAERLLTTVEQLSAVEIALFAAIVTAAEAKEAALGDLLTAPPRNGYSAVEQSQPTGHWVLALSAITKYGYQSGHLKSAETTKEVLAATLQTGDLVVSRSNTLELVGLPAIFDEERRDISRPDTMMLLQPDEAQIRRQFLELFLRSPDGRRQVRSYAAGTSASMKKINGTNLQKILVPRPELEIQLQVEQATNEMREGRRRVLGRIEEVRTLKSRLLKETIG